MLRFVRILNPLINRLRSCSTTTVRVAAGIFLLALLSHAASAQTVTLRLDCDLTSRMPTGTPFEAHDTAGKVYHGHIVTHPARRMMRNGSMLLIFDEDVKTVTKDREGAYRGGNKVRLLKLGGSLALAKTRG
jgi:hypothetical protein